MILAEINELSTIDNTIHTLHQKLSELYDRRREIVLPSEQQFTSLETHEEIAANVLDTLDLSLDTPSPLALANNHK